MSQYGAMITYTPRLDSKKIAWHWSADIFVTDQETKNSTCYRITSEYGFWDKSDAEGNAKRCVDLYIDALKQPNLEFYEPKDEDVDN